MTSLKHVDHRQRKSFILLVAGILLLWPGMSLALTDCSFKNAADYCSKLTAENNSDCDSDGFTDWEECKGFSSLGGERIYGYSQTPSSTNDIKLNPVEPDLLFLAVDYQDLELTTGLMYDALQSAKEHNALSFYADSLRVHAHQITSAYCDDKRHITATTRAAKILELSTPSFPNDEDLGRTKVSVPTDIETVSKIYTARIGSDVTEKCKGVCCSVYADRKTPLVDLCATRTQGEANKAVLNFYILQVIAHEMGHGSKLANDDPTTQYHHSGSGTVMDPAVGFKKPRYTMPIQFKLPDDKNNLKLYDPTLVSN